MGILDSVIGGESREEEFQKEMQEKQADAAKEQAAMQSAQGDMVQIERQNDRSDLTRWQQKLDDELEHIKQLLRNNTYSQEKQEWVSKKEPYLDENGDKKYRDVPPLMNEVGIQKFEQMATPWLSRNMMNSNFNEGQIMDMLRRTCTTFLMDLIENLETYEVGMMGEESQKQSPSSAVSAIIDVYKTIIKPTPFRALNDGERRHQREFRRSIETTTRKPDTDESSGMFGGVF